MSAGVQPTAGPGAPPRIRCRPIAEADAEGLVALLHRGFPDRARAYWEKAVARLMDHARALPEPVRGQLIEADGTIVGALLLIAAAPGPGGAAGRRCNVSSWYVDPPFRAYASLLVERATRRRDVTFFNISPAPHTVTTIEAQGYRRYAAGRVLAAPFLAAPRVGVRVRAFDPARPGALDPALAAIIARHVTYGCLALVAEGPEGAEPFLFLPWRIRGRLPGAILVFCPSLERFARLAGPLGRALVRRGMPFVLVDGCEGLPGVPSRQVGERSLKYARGSDHPWAGDLTDTEFVMFGP